MMRYTDIFLTCRKLELNMLENPQKLALTSPTGGVRSVGIVRLRTKVTEWKEHPENHLHGSEVKKVCLSIMYRRVLQGQWRYSSIYC